MYSGLVEGLSNQEYQSSPGVSSSGLRELINGTPEHYKAYVDGKREPTESMKFGTAAHMAILEPELFLKTYVQKPKDCHFGTQAGKGWKAEQLDKGIKEGGFISYEKYEDILAICTKLKHHKKAQELFRGAVAESSIFWKFDASKDGLLCRCRPDLINLNREMLIDIKTMSKKASNLNYMKSTREYGYHVQAAHYLNGASSVFGQKITDFVHIMIESEHPYSIGLYRLNYAAIERTMVDIERAMEVIKRCTETGIWYGFPEEIIETSLPSWMFEEE